jgi:hypothetical protein
VCFTQELVLLKCVNTTQDTIGVLMRRGVDSFSPSSWEPQEKGMMSTAASFPSVRNQGLSV